MGFLEFSCLIEELSYVGGEVVVDEDLVVVGYVFSFVVWHEGLYCWCVSSFELVFDGVVLESYDYVGPRVRVCLSVSDCSVCCEVAFHEVHVLSARNGKYDFVEFFILFTWEVFKYQFAVRFPVLVPVVYFSELLFVYVRIRLLPSLPVSLVLVLLLLELVVLSLVSVRL